MRARQDGVGPWRMVERVLGGHGTRKRAWSESGGLGLSYRDVNPSNTDIMIKLVPPRQTKDTIPALLYSGNNRCLASRLLPPFLFPFPEAQRIFLWCGGPQPDEIAN